MLVLKFKIFSFQPLQFSVHNVQILHPHSFNCWIKREWKGKIKPDKPIGIFPSMIPKLRLASPKKKVLAFMNNSFVFSLHCNIDQNRSQYVPLKISCIKNECLTLSKIISFWQHYIVQHIAIVPVRILMTSWSLKFCSHLPIMWVLIYVVLNHYQFQQSSRLPLHVEIKNMKR